jgi:uncharacterized membrane protein YeaQ/YmgE (transglycosylase-associated protein family)
MEILWSILIGIAAGWLAALLTKVRGIGLVGYLVIGILGAVLGGWLFRILGFAAVSPVGRVVSATVGALLLIALVKWLRRKLR